MNHSTTPTLIALQQEFWNEDLAMPGDFVTSDTEKVSISSLILNSEIQRLYEEADSAREEKINELVVAFQNGVCLPPLLIEQDNSVIDGYHRLIAATRAGLSEVLVIRLIRG